MNRLGIRILLAMLIIAIVSLSVVPIAQVIAERVTFAQLPEAFRERVEAQTRPRPFFGPSRLRGRGADGVALPSAGGGGQLREGDVAVPGEPDFREETLRLFALLADFRTAQQRALVGGILVALILCVALAWWISRTIAWPLEAVSEGAARLARGSLDSRVPRPSRLQPIETRELAEGFNAMAASLEALEGERRAMIADIAHELRTPLAALSMRLEAIDDGIVSFDREEVALLRRHAALLARLIDDLRLLSLADAGRLRLDREVLDLTAWLSRSAAAYAHTVGKAGAELQVEVPDEPVFVHADAQRLQQVLQNLLDNAARVSPQGETVRVSLEVAGDVARIRVLDQGPGIPEGELGTIFERFMQGRRRDVAGVAGSGLGLAIVRTLVGLHGGTVVAHNRETGAELIVTLPLEDAAGRANAI